MAQDIAERYHVVRLAEVVDHASEVPSAVCFERAGRQVQRECRAVLAPATHAAADVDDFLWPVAA
jgi:hypothetical protein